MTSAHVDEASGPAKGPRDDRSIGELFGELATETSTLVRQEIDLATTEMTHKASYAGKQTAWIATGALLGLVALHAFAAALIVALDAVMALWLSALLVAAVFGAVAFAIAGKGLAALRGLELKPKHTIESLQEDKSWAQRQIR